MAVKQELNTLLNKKMDRKDFLKVVGVAVVAATGVGTLLRTVNPRTNAKNVSATPQGYGSSAYGGGAPKTS